MFEIDEASATKDALGCSARVRSRQKVVRRLTARSALHFSSEWNHWVPGGVNE